MSRHVVFVTTEYDPVVPGGAGAVVAGLDRLLSESGVVVTVVLVTDAQVAGQPGLVVVDPAPADGRRATAEAASKAAFEAVLGLAHDHPADLIEFQDFEGLAFWTLTHRNGTPLETTPIVVRYHLPADHILDAIGAVRPEFNVVRVMERASLRSADAVIVQAPSMAETICERYGTERERIVHGTPPIAGVDRVGGDRSPAPRLVVVGRLSEQKGTHDAVRSLGPILEANPDLTLEFVGSDGWSATADMPMRDWAATLASPGVRGQIVFTDPVPREDLPAYLSGAWAVLVPSRLESFCLAAHEARAMGLPLIARNLPAVADYFDEEHGALLYDGTDGDLRRVVSEAMAEPISPRRASRGTPAGRTAIPCLAYLGDLPTPRHPQSQAGLATAALHRLDEEVEDAGPGLRWNAAVRRGAF